MAALFILFEEIKIDDKNGKQNFKEIRNNRCDY